MHWKSLDVTRIQMVSGVSELCVEIALNLSVLLLL
jgi:hypothetical protein